MKISPTVLSIFSLPFVTLWIISGIVYNMYRAPGGADSTPDFWIAIFLVGGPLAASVVGGVVTIRLQERQKLSTVDKLAIWVSVIGAVLCVGSLAYAYF